MTSIVYISEKYKLIQESIEQLITHITLTNELSHDVKFAIVPIVETKDEFFIKELITQKIYPIAISDRAELFNANLFPHIGFNAPEITLLQHIFSNSEEIYNTFLQQRNHILQQLNFPENYQTKFALTINTHLQSAYPLYDKYGFLLDETDVLNSIWEYLIKQFPKNSEKKILFFGTGKFLTRFLNVNKNRDVPNIFGATDDSITKKQHKNGITLYPPQEINKNDFDTIFLATDSLIELFKERCHTLFGDTISLLDTTHFLSNSKKFPLKIPQKIIPSLPAPQKNYLQAIIVCVNYSDILSWTLPLNTKIFDKIVIVTSSSDIKTQEIAKRHNADIVISDSYKKDGAKFNKGAMLNAGYSKLSHDNWCVVTDADIIFQKGFKENIFKKMRNQNVLYYAIRLDTPTTKKETWLEQYKNNPDIACKLIFNRPGANKMPWGYMQLVHPKSCFLNKNEPFYPDHFDSAVDVDYAFQEKWKQSYKILLPELLIHIEHGTEGCNWNGRQSPPLSPPTQ